MADEKMVSEKDAVLREREAFVRGWRCGWACNADTESGAISKAAEEYPLPEVKRPRYANDPEFGGVRWLVRDNAICGESIDEGFWVSFSNRHTACVPTLERVAVWADLLANPTEEVEADA